MTRCIVIWLALFVLAVSSLVGGVQSTLYRAGRVEVPDTEVQPWLQGRHVEAQHSTALIEAFAPTPITTATATLLPSPSTIPSVTTVMAVPTGLSVSTPVPGSAKPAELIGGGAVAATPALPVSSSSILSRLVQEKPPPWGNPVVYVLLAVIYLALFAVLMYGIHRLDG